ncbi:helix-turn-helix domain-containing protein [Rhizobium sp. C4]|uniref:helix-turn-helix domain-containing protein n=1 Tax=Rhizobium sp. C4 TaxID=1349800 RepID=UPI001E3E13CD|nr:helix-turn-helix domain-containing protein [Rhizobium sp. C4]MCD2175250.1 helix-turn-helix domain-containing protein [Rhizobium sp. C4]
MKMDNGKTAHSDWTAFDAMTDAEATANALADHDNPPATAEQLTPSRRMPQVRVIRRALGLTQEEFSARYRIPLGTLRDWEQGRTEPDQPARAYLKVIATDPERTAQALANGAA